MRILSRTVLRQLSVTLRATVVCIVMTSRRRYAPCQVLSKTAAPTAHPAVVIQCGAVCIKRMPAAPPMHPAG